MGRSNVCWHCIDNTSSYGLGSKLHELSNASMVQITCDGTACMNEAASFYYVAEANAHFTSTTAAEVVVVGGNAMQAHLHFSLV